jgi:hypothetical protein
MNNLEALIGLKEKYNLNSVTEIAIKQHQIKEILYHKHQNKDYDWYNVTSIKMLDNYYKRLFGNKKKENG